MVDSLDIARSAKLLIEQKGDGAVDYAQEQMLELIQDDDAKGAGVWMAIAHDIKRMLAGSKQVH